MEQGAGWALPAVGAAEAVVSAMVAAWWLGVCGVLVAIIGLLLWNTRRAAWQIRRASGHHDDP